MPFLTIWRMESAFRCARRRCHVTRLVVEDVFALSTELGISSPLEGNMAIEATRAVGGHMTSAFMVYRLPCVLPSASTLSKSPRIWQEVWLNSSLAPRLVSCFTDRRFPCSSGMKRTFSSMAWHHFPSAGNRTWTRPEPVMGMVLLSPSMTWVGFVNVLKVWNQSWWEHMVLDAPESTIHWPRRSLDTSTCSVAMRAAPVMVAQ